MKRRIFKLVVFLLFGAIFNVAAAWSEVFWPLAPSTNVRVLSPAELERTRPPNSQLEAGYGVRQEWPLLTWDDIAAMSQDNVYRPSYNVYHQGWPARSLRGWYYRTDLGPKTEYALFRQRARGFAVFPLRPVWPGFAINTIFYAAILWLPFAAFGRIRRRRRIKRGLCVRCGYSLRGNSGGGTCPECGLEQINSPGR